MNRSKHSNRSELSDLIVQKPAAAMKEREREREQINTNIYEICRHKQYLLFEVLSPPRVMRNMRFMRTIRFMRLGSPEAFDSCESFEPSEPFERCESREDNAVRLLASARSDRIALIDYECFERFTCFDYTYYNNITI